MTKLVWMTKPLAPIVVEILFCFDFTFFRMTKCGAKKIATDSGIKLLKKTLSNRINFGYAQSSI
ncbi:hypothetical protein IO90_14135 [Chryseobacterium sp. FH1]|nr:hypothetical protein IO90_14135 [Chryseobacterium sp. FH1]